MKFLLHIFLIISISVNLSNAQIRSFQSLSKPEKKWVLHHPFVARKALQITKDVLKVCQKKDTHLLLDTFVSGGRLDAFRHIYWMACLTKFIGPKKAKELGIAHEKANYFQFLCRQLEDGDLPDYPSSKMDSLNNLLGIRIGENWRKVNANPNMEEVVSYINKGRCYVLKRNAKGEFLNCSNNVILVPELRKWRNSKCVVLLSTWKNE
jgi:hypothetical protein